MFRINLSNRERRLFILTVLIISLSLIYNFIFDPLINRCDELKKEILIKKAQLQKAAQLIRARDRIEAEFKKLSGFMGRAGSQEEAFTLLLKEIEELARKSDVHINEIKPRPVKKAAFYKNYSIDLEITAEMDGIIRFLYAISSSSSLLNVERIRLDSQTKPKAGLKGHLLISKILLP